MVSDNDEEEIGEIPESENEVKFHELGQYQKLRIMYNHNRTLYFRIKERDQRINSLISTINQLKVSNKEKVAKLNKEIVTLKSDLDTRLNSKISKKFKVKGDGNQSKTKPRRSSS